MQNYAWTEGENVRVVYKRFGCLMYLCQHGKVLILNDGSPIGR